MNFFLIKTKGVFFFKEEILIVSIDINKICPIIIIINIIIIIIIYVSYIHVMAMLFWIIEINVNVKYHWRFL